MRLCLTTLFTREIEKESRPSTWNKKKYCEKYGIHQRFYFGRMSQRHAQWDKIQCLIQNLPEFDYVIWMDSDAVFNNFNVSFEKLLQENSTFDALFCRDVCYQEGQNHLLINSGVMVFKNTEWSSYFLNKVWTSIRDYKKESLEKHSYDGFPHEQGKICDLLMQLDHEDHVKIFPTATFNAHPNISNDQTFIIHFMGSRASAAHLATYETRLEKINQKIAPKDESRDFELIFLPPETPPLRVCLVTLYTENLTKVADVMNPNKRSYAKKHGYDFKVHVGRLSKRHPAWDKVLLLRNTLASNGYDYVVWIDNDAYIANPEIRFDVLFRNHPKAKFLVCAEEDYRHLGHLEPTIDFNQLHNLRIINTGVMAAQNHPWALSLLKEVWETKSNTNRGIDGSHQEFPEASSFISSGYSTWPFEQGPFHIVLSRKDKGDYKIFAPEIMNKFRSSHRRHHFICHFVGEGSNHVAIQNHIETYLQSRVNFDKDAKRTITHVKCRGKTAILEWAVWKHKLNPKVNVLKFSWDLAAFGECLSHAFKIVSTPDAYTRQWNFDSTREAHFEFPSHLKTVEIFHSFDFFGEVDWQKLV